MFTVPPEIARLYAIDSPVASLYLYVGTDASSENRPHAQLRWRALRERMATRGLDEPVLRALDACVLGARPGGRTLAGFATGSELAWCTEYDDREPADVGWAGPLAYGLPLLRWCQSRPPYVLALVDRTGADLTTYPGAGDPGVREHVAGTDDEIERNAPGGWAQGRYQHRAEDSWEHNAAEVARELTRLATRARARLVLAAGDVRALQYLQEHLPKQVRERVRLVPADGAQHDDGPAGVRPETVRKAVADAVDAGIAELLRTYADAATAAVTAGAEPTARALSDSRVRTLLVVDDPGDERLAYVGEGTPGVALWPDTAHPTEVRLVDALARAACRTAADVVVLRPGDSADLTDGVGALLRH